MFIALRMRLIANSPPNVNPKSRAIRFSSIVVLPRERVNVGWADTFQERRVARVSSVSAWRPRLRLRYLRGDPGNVIAFALFAAAPSAMLLAPS